MRSRSANDKSLGQGNPEMEEPQKCGYADGMPDICTPFSRSEESGIFFVLMDRANAVGTS